MSFLFLLFLHHIGDVAFQPGWLIENKKAGRVFAFHEHVMVWTGTICVGLFLLGILAPWKIAFLYIVHFAIDWFIYKHIKGYWRVWPDQALHYAQIAIVFFL